MTTMRKHFEMLRATFGPHTFNDFMLEYGREYAVGPDTFKGPRGEPKNCFGNATHLAAKNPTLTYVEGVVASHGIPIAHAWCVDANDIVVDPTIVNGKKMSGYYGVPFLTDYVRRATLLNGYYGLLDYFVASKTAPKLFELGLPIGQLWLLNQPQKRRRRKVTKVVQAACILLALGVSLLSHDAVAQTQETFRNSNGQIVGRAVTNNAGTTFYNPQGQQTGRAVTNNAGTTFYNAVGQQTGRASRGR